jgi:hypothetical protein
MPRLRAACLLILGACAFSPVSWGQLQAPGKPKVNQPTSNRQLELPLSFEPNRGQAAPGVDYVTTSQGHAWLLRADSVSINVGGSSGLYPDGKPVSQNVVQIGLFGADPKAAATSEDKLTGYSNYLFGSNPANWITLVEHYGKVRYQNVYPGIDLLFHGNENRLEQDFVLRPGAQPQRISFRFPGLQHAELSDDGDLVLRAGDGTFRMQKPRAYQQVRNEKVEVPVQYSLNDGSLSFRLGSYDKRRELIIDPVLVYSTFLGGSNAGTLGNSVTAIAADSTGVYVTGFTNATNFPVTPGALDPTSSCCSPTFVAKLDPTGQTLLFSTYLQGFQNAPSVAVDSSGDLYLAALAAGFEVLGGGVAANLPIPAGSQPYQPKDKGYANVAILKLNSTGTAVLAGTYLGGSNFDYFSGLAIDSANNVYVTGITNSNDFPVLHPAQPALGSGGQNGFISKLNSSLSTLVYSTYFGNQSKVFVNLASNGNGVSGLTTNNLLALDSSDNVYVVGEANAGFATSGAYLATCSATQCPFLAELKSDGSTILSATYLDNNPDTATGVAVDSSGNVYVAGFTPSSTFPVVNPIQPCSSIGTDMEGNFVSEFSSAGSLVFSTCLGLSSFQAVPALAMDASGNAYIAGVSLAGLPLQNPIDSNAPASGTARLYVSEISGSSHTLLFSSYVAGSLAASQPNGGDSVNAVAVDSTGNVYLAGQSAPTPSGMSQFPHFDALNPVFCSNVTPGCHAEGFIMKISPSAGAAAAVAPGAMSFPTSAVGTTSSPQTLTILDLGTDALTVSSVTVSGDFAIQSNTCTSIAASTSCAIPVTFTPTTTGTRTGTLTITDSSPGSPRTIALTGQGASVNLGVSPSSLTFPTQQMGTASGPQFVTLTAGPAAISALSIQTTGDFFESNNCGVSIPAFQTCSLTVTFSPTANGSRTGTITITDSAPNSPQTVSLSGNGGSTLGLMALPGNSITQTVTAGTQATFPLSIGGQGISGTASVSCSGAPPNGNCSVPATVSVSGTSSSAFAVNVTTTAHGLAIPSGQRTPFTPRPWALASAIAFMLALLCRKRTQPRLALAYLILVFMPLVLALGGCGGGPTSSSATGTAAGTYKLTVTAKVGSTSQSITLTLNVQ